jgi:hypothetical protein
VKIVYALYEQASLTDVCAQYIQFGRFLSPSMRQECLKMYIMKLNQYMICIDNVTIKNIGNAMYKPSIYIWIIVYTCLSHVHTEIQISVLVYAIRKHVQNMFVPCLYLDIPTQTSSYMLQTAQSTLSTCFACNKKTV